MKPLKIVIIVLATLVAGFFVANWYGGYRMMTGYEIEATDYAPYLKKELEADLGYRGFEHSWLQKAWVNSFKDHTHLFVVTGNAIGLREAIEKVTSEAPGQPTIFNNGNYLGPSTAPDWWDTARTDAAESRYFKKDFCLWRFTWLDDRLYIVHITT